MIFTLPIWSLPLAATVLLWGAISLRPSSYARGGGDYNFGPPIDALFRGTIGVIVTLAIWLVYFALMYFWGR